MIVAVLSYRAIAFWLPTVPGALVYVRLRRDLDREDAEEHRNGDGDEHDDRDGRGLAGAAQDGLDRGRARSGT